MARKTVLLQGIKFRDTLIITLKGANKDLFKKVDGYNVILFPAIVDEDAVVDADIDEPSLLNVRIDHLLLSSAKANIEGVKQEGLFFNKKPITEKQLAPLQKVLYMWDLAEKFAD